MGLKGLKYSKEPDHEALQLINKMLKSILLYTRSQCKDAETSVIWSHLLALIKGLEAELCTVCRGSTNHRMQ